MELNDGAESSSSSNSSILDPKRRRVGLVYDERMCRHRTRDLDNNAENPDRIRYIWGELNSSGIAQRCVIVNAKKSEDSHLARVHSKNHIHLIKNISSTNFQSTRKEVAAKFDSIFFNEGSSEAAYIAAGSVIEAADKVARGQLDSAFAIVRPPGHHAEKKVPMGFCLFNNVAVAASFLLDERSEFGIQRILIVDWDVHHGNGTQKMFYNDPRVLFFSVHRHDSGNFYPGSDDGSYTMTGEGQGAGYNINVPWENSKVGDGDYNAVWDHILIPVAKEFNPDIIIISAGFDAAEGDSVGDCCVSPYGYSIMLNKLMKFGGGKIVMALEGGYNLDALTKSAKACVQVLLRDKHIIASLSVMESLEDYPFASTWRVINHVREELSVYWPVLAPKLPDEVTSRTEISRMILLLYQKSRQLRMLYNLSRTCIFEPFLSTFMAVRFSKIDISYATYGSIMKISRSLGYI